MILKASLLCARAKENSLIWEPIDIDRRDKHIHSIYKGLNPPNVSEQTSKKTNIVQSNWEQNNIMKNQPSWT